MKTSEQLQFLSRTEKIGTLLTAFSLRDIQVANTLVTWLSQNEITGPQFQEYVTVWVEINRLQSSGYFSRDPSPEVGKRILFLERAIQNPVVRTYARKMRLAATRFDEKGGPGKGI